MYILSKNKEGRLYKLVLKNDLQNTSNTGTEYTEYNNVLTS